MYLHVVLSAKHLCIIAILGHCDDGKSCILIKFINYLDKQHYVDNAQLLPQELKLVLGY